MHYVLLIKPSFNLTPCRMRTCHREYKSFSTCIRFLKTFWPKEILVIMSNFSFCHIFFNSFQSILVNLRLFFTIFCIDIFKLVFGLMATHGLNVIPILSGGILLISFSIILALQISCSTKILNIRYLHNLISM